MTHTIIINASPRKTWNTAQLLQEAQKGAESVGDTVEYIDLYDLNFTGCRSCLVCKKKGIDEPCKCYWKDDLTPVLDKIYKADRLIIGTPIYFGETTAHFRALLERVCFPAFTYNDYSSIFKGKIDVDIFLTMNVGKEHYDTQYAEHFATSFYAFRHLNGEIRIHPCFDTTQVSDYTKYEMAGWDSEHKKMVHDTQFPLDLRNAFEVGAGNQ